MHTPRRLRSFEGRVAAVTGAASGMGRSLAIALARRGCHLALSDVSEAELARTVALARDAASAAGRDVKVSSERVDVGEGAARLRAWADAVVRDHGRCNLLFNNAGISYGATVSGCEDDELERVMRVNFWGVVHGTRAFLPHLVASGEGHVINTSSLFGLLAFPGQCAYNASKFAVRGFTEALRIELEITGAPVSATCVHPGGIKTNIARASRMHESLKELGIEDVSKVPERFERLFRVSADDAAEVILRGTQKNARRVLIGTDARFFDLVQRLMPASYQSLVVRSARRVLS